LLVNSISSNNQTNFGKFWKIKSKIDIHNLQMKQNINPFEIIGVKEIRKNKTFDWQYYLVEASGINQGDLAFLSGILDNASKKVSCDDISRLNRINLDSPLPKKHLHNSITVPTGHDNLLAIDQLLEKCQKTINNRVKRLLAVRVFPQALGSINQEGIFILSNSNAIRQLNKELLRSEFLPQKNAAMATASSNLSVHA